MMWLFTGCLLLASSATFAADYAPYTGIQAHRNPNNYALSGSVYPIDYSDELNIKNPLIKPGNLIFSFEQTRRDQPPQVDNREEALGKYMYRHKPTTTTMQVPQMMPELEDFPVIVPDSRAINHQERYPSGNTWQPMTAMLATTTTSAVPSALASFNEFSLSIPTSQINTEARYPPVQKWASRAMPPPPPPPSPKWEEVPVQLREMVHPVHENQPMKPVPEQEQRPVDGYHSRIEEVPLMPQPYWTEIAGLTTLQHSGGRNRHEETPRGVPNRGHHKFSWDDGRQDTPSSTSTPAPVRVPKTTEPQRKPPPPPVPTLTPWGGDNFRK